MPVKVSVLESLEDERILVVSMIGVRVGLEPFSLSQKVRLGISYFQVAPPATPWDNNIVIFQLSGGATLY